MSAFHPPLPLDPLVEPLIDRVYQLATQLGGMTDITALLARHTRSRSCAIILQDRHSYATRGGWYWGVDHVWAAAYVERYYACDPTVAEHFRIPAESAYASPLDADNPTFRDSEFYRDFCVPQRLGYFAGAYSLLGEDTALRLTLQGDVGRGGYEPETLALMRTLLPHLRRAVDIHRDVARLISQAQALSTVLEQSRSALLLLSPAGEVLYANDAARGLADGAAFSLHGARLAIRDRDTQTQLQAAIGACAFQLRGTAATVMQGGCHVPLPRAGGLPLSAYLAPFRLQRANDWDPLPAELITLTIVDPEEQRSVDAQALREALKLTEAEARVATSLCEGASAREIALRYGISPHTVREHIKRIYRRTGVGKQSEFVARAWSVLRVRGGR